MPKPQLHIPQKDSPSTFLVGNITDATTTITLSDSSIFDDPYAPIDRLTINFDGATTETVDVLEYLTGNQILVTRGSPAYAWLDGTKIARVLTSMDVNEYIDYFDYLDDAQTDILADVGEVQDSIQNDILPFINLINSVGGRKYTFRGNYIGDTFSSAQKNAILNGTFTDLYLGDYWTINGINYRIVDFNYWTPLFNRSLGDYTNHVVVVPDNILTTQRMDEYSEVPLPYYNSTMRAYLANTVNITLTQAFKNYNRLYYENLRSTLSDYNEVTARTEIMSESMLFGQGIMRAFKEPSYSNNQFALFRVMPKFIKSNAAYWLRDLGTDCSLGINEDGLISKYTALEILGVRPCFPVMGFAPSPG